MESSELKDFAKIQDKLLNRSDYDKSLRICLADLFAEDEITISKNIEETQSKLHCFFLLPNKQKTSCDYENLAQKMMENIIPYVIPRQKILEKRNSPMFLQEVERLRETARKKFIDFWIEKKIYEEKNVQKKKKRGNLETGEGGELLLFLLAEQKLKLPQAICKMKLKTSEKMPIHGSDGIHVGLTENGKNLAIYYGESKVYKNRTTAIKNCLESIRPLLIEGKDELELELLNDNFDLTEENKELEKALVDYFDYNHYKNKEFTEIRGICLIGFNEEECYSCLDRKKIAQSIVTQMEEWVKGFREQVKINTLEKVFIHVIFIPFHSVDDFRKAFKKVIKYEDK